MESIRRKRESLPESIRNIPSRFPSVLPYLFLLCFIFLSGSACHHNGKVASTDRPPGSDPGDDTWLIERYKRRGDDLLSLDGFFKILVSSEKENRRVKGVFIFQKPHYFYLEFISPFGTTKVVASSDSEKIVIYYPDENEYFEGEATGENIEKIFGLRLEPEEIFLIFSGQFIDFRKYGEVTLEMDTLRKAVRGVADSLDGLERAMFWMKPEFGGLIAGFLSDKAGHITLGVHYGDFTKIGGLDIPRRVFIDKTDFPWRIVFTGKNVRINETREAGVFTINPAPGSTRIPLERLDSEHPLLFWEGETGDGK